MDTVAVVQHKLVDNHLWVNVPLNGFLRAPCKCYSAGTPHWWEVEVQDKEAQGLNHLTIDCVRLRLEISVHVRPKWKLFLINFENQMKNPEKRKRINQYSFIHSIRSHFPRLMRSPCLGVPGRPSQAGSRREGRRKGETEGRHNENIIIELSWLSIYY